MCFSVILALDSKRGQHDRDERTRQMSKSRTHAICLFASAPLFALRRAQLYSRLSPCSQQHGSYAQDTETTLKQESDPQSKKATIAVRKQPSKHENNNWSMTHSEHFCYQVLYHFQFNNRAFNYHYSHF
jgi:hypothetical protein